MRDQQEQPLDQPTNIKSPPARREQSTQDIGKGDQPPPLLTFLPEQTHNFAGKSLRPFITHGGYGLGNSLAVLRSNAPNARIAEPFSMEADQERRTLNQLRGWLDEIGLR